MKQASDWRDALSSLLPADYTEPSEASELSESSENSAFPLQKLRVDIERKGRGGKTATIISGFSLDDEQIGRIAASLKKRLGTGGSARGGEILIQGDRRDDVLAALRQMGIIK